MQKYNHSLINLMFIIKYFMWLSTVTRKITFLEILDVHNLVIFSGSSQPEFGVYIYPLEY